MIEVSTGIAAINNSLAVPLSNFLMSSKCNSLAACAMSLFTSLCSSTRITLLVQIKRPPIKVTCVRIKE